MKYALFPVDEMPPGTMRPARIGSINIVVVRTKDGEFHALRDICPHHGAQLSQGSLLETIVGDEPGVRALADSLILRCPWHAHEFALNSGRCVADAAQRVRVYDVSIEGGTVVVRR